MQNPRRTAPFYTGDTQLGGAVFDTVKKTAGNMPKLVEGFRPQDYFILLGLGAATYALISSYKKSKTVYGKVKDTAKSVGEKIRQVREVFKKKN